MIEVDFTACNLSAAVFNDCDLSGAVFYQSNLEKTDFRTAFNYTIDPSVNKMKKALFSVLGLAGLLNKYDIVIEKNNPGLL